MPLIKRRESHAAVMLYDRCARLFAGNRPLVNMSSGCCDGYLGLVSPDGATTYQLTFYQGEEGCYAIWNHHERPGEDTTSFIHSGGLFTQRGTLSADLVESVLATFTPARLDDGA